MADQAEHDESVGRDVREASILDALGELREQHAAKETEQFPVPGYQGHLWITARVPDGGRVTAVMGALTAGRDGGASTAANFLADYVTSLFLAQGEDRDDAADGEPGTPIDPFPFPGCPDGDPMGLDERLETVRSKGEFLVPARPGHRTHTPATRIRALVNNDVLMCGLAMAVCVWAGGGGDGKPGAVQRASVTFVGE